MKLNLAIFHHISSACNSTSSICEQNTKIWTVIYPHAKFEKAAPVTIKMFDQVKLTTSTKVYTLKAQKVVL